MNKAELIDAVAEKGGISKVDARKAIEATLEVFTETLAKGDQIALVGFGTFAVKDRAARTGKNPQTGEPIAIEAAKVPNFKAGKGLKDAINQK
ncbi:HU family DNA-binding protein [Geopseudomonas aromaticivorans]